MEKKLAARFNVLPSRQKIMINPYIFDGEIEPSYDNEGGKGDRRTIITVTSTSLFLNGTESLLVDGLFSPTLYFKRVSVESNYILFYFTCQPLYISLAPPNEQVRLIYL
jgi:hypothetical protein